MALLFTSPSSLFTSFKNPKPLFLSSLKLHSSLSFSHTNPTKTFPLRPLISRASSQPDQPAPEPDSEPSAEIPVSITDEWGEKTEPEPEPEPTKLPDSDPPRNEDEWEEEEGEEGEEGEVEEEGHVSQGNGTAGQAVEEDDNKLADLKKSLVDTVYGTEFGFRAGAEVRAEVLELANQLEALNPTPRPVETAGVLDGNWVLLYTAFSELLPLLAAGATPLLKVEKISQTIDTSSLSIENSTTLSSPFATFSFSASASFEVRSPSRIQVQFKETTFQPPDIKSAVSLPENVDIFGQNVSLLPVQQSLSPLQEAAANIARAISGQPPLKIPIRSERAKSWLLITYLDEDLRISRGDGGLFVLVKEGSPLLN